MNIIYLRVSKEDEKLQDPEQQLNAIKDKFKLKEYVLLQDRGSAYDLDKLHKRTDFLKLMQICFNSKTFTIEDLYLQKAEKKDITLYVWDSSRIIRNIELSMIFLILATKFGVKIIPYEDNSILKEPDNEDPSARFVRMMMNSISAYASEQYSYTISKNIKKSFNKGYSTYGNKWGNKFRGTSDNLKLNDKGKVDLSEKEVKALRRRILFLKNKKYTIGKVRVDIAKNFKLSLSDGYISGVK